MAERNDRHTPGEGAVRENKVSKDRNLIRTPSAPTDDASSESALVALVTGANRGIGFETCRRLAARRFAVLLTARDAAKARAAATKLAKVGTVEPLPLDVADANSIKDATAEVARRHGRLDVLINNAGINYDTWETVENADIHGTRILVNVVCPGWVATDMGGTGAPRSVSEGAAGIVWAATLPDDGPTGGFFRDGKPLPW